MLATGGVGLAAAFDDSFSSTTGIIMVLTLYPLGAAAASYGVGQVSGTEGTFGGTVRGAYIGAGLGLVVGVPISALLLRAASPEETPSSINEGIGTTFLALSVGAMIYIGGTLIGSVRGYNASVQPTVVRNVDGQMVPAARLTIAF
ncbi:MAG: hypothetical protein ABJF88_09805 [Rhodothermales bacterium]